MLTKINATAILLLFATMSLVSFAQQKAVRITDPIPVDAKVITGKFDNGLAYYVRQNKKPENRMELRLVVKTGSVMEDDDQQGLAHFIEHLCFNGTKNFPKQDLVNFLESIGVRFGAHLNAYTSFDETVYMLRVPTDKPTDFKKAFQVLEDWASNVSFENTEIEKERGVVGEEWRLGKGAGERIRNKQFPTLLYKSKYADRIPIGKKEIIDKAPYDAFKRFYRDWYRPNLMAVIAVGDFDPTVVANEITAHFSHLTNPANPRERTQHTLPDHDQTLVTIATDKELPQSMISVYFKRPEKKVKKVGQYRYGMMGNLYDAMLNNRLEEIMQRPTSPFAFAYAGDDRFIGDKQAFTLAASPKNALAALDTLMTEVMRVQQHGFTESELEREKKNLLRRFESQYNERDKTESDNYADEYVRNFLEEEPIPGIEYEYELHKKYVPTISIEEINGLTKDRLTANNRIIAVSAPEKADVEIPKEEEILNLVTNVATRKTEAYKDEASNKTLLAATPAPGKVVSTKKNDAVGFTEWKLSNGINVIAKKTDFKNDEILMTAYSPGGSSLVANEEYMSAMAGTILPNVSGVGDFDAIGLQKYLAGKVVSVSPYISDTHEGFQGNASPDDLETLFQLVYAYVTIPREDTSAFSAMISRYKTMLQNRKSSPEAAFQDTLQVTLSNYHHRARPITPELFDELNADKGFAFYKDRFQDLGDFTFFFVGNFSPDTLKMFCEKYLASLPTKNRKESWRDYGLRPPKGKIVKEVYRGIEPKSSVQLVITGDFEWTLQNRFELQAMMEVFQIKLREVLREEKGGVYGVMASASPMHYPIQRYAIRIGFGCNPERVDELLGEVQKQIDSLRTAKVLNSYIEKVKELQTRDLETNLKENDFWLSSMSQYLMHGEDVNLILERGKRIASINQDLVLRAAQKYLDQKNVVKVVLYPEKK